MDLGNYKRRAIVIGRNLRFKGCVLPELEQQLKDTHDLLVHASTCPLDLDLISETNHVVECPKPKCYKATCPVDSIVETNHVVECQYPKCYDGKVLWAHVSICSRNNCLLCEGLYHIGMFHAGQCTDPNCGVPRCSEFRDHICRKERKARKIEIHKEKLQKASEIEKHREKIWEIRDKEDKKASKMKRRLQSLRKKEGKQKRIRAMPIAETQLAAATALQLTLNEDQGVDQQPEIHPCTLDVVECRE